MEDQTGPSPRTTVRRGKNRAHWAGVVPLTSTWGDPIPAGDLRGHPPIPDGVAGLAGTDAHA